MTTITFTDEHLAVIQTALEVYSRLRSGQIKIAMDEAFYDYLLTWEESESIERFVRPIIFTGPPELKYDGHGGYYDQYGHTYDENGNRESEETWVDKCRANRPYLSGNNSYFGVGHERMNQGGGTLAYEIYQTIRQYDALKNSGGYYEFGTNYNDPLELTGVPLPKIEGFTKEKRFPIKGKAIVNKLKKAEETKDYSKVWEVVGDYVARHYPELEGYSRGNIEKDGEQYVLITKGARKKKEKNGL